MGRRRVDFHFAIADENRVIAEAEVELLSDETLRETVWGRSGGKNEAQTTSESHADLKAGDRVASLHASAGLVRETTLAMHPSGSAEKSGPSRRFASSIAAIARNGCG